MGVTASPVSILFLGAGWTSSFLIPLCTERSLRCAATTRDGREGTIKFAFDPKSIDLDAYRILPDAQTVLITFPITAPGGSKHLVKSYLETRTEGSPKVQFIQLGSSGIWDRRAKGAAVPLKRVEHRWYDRHTPFDPNDRAEEEIELLKLSETSEVGTTVLNLVGLWGGLRSPRNWVARVAPTKEALRNKGSIHLIHGLDVARAILSVHANFSKANGERWLVSDGRVYDWWDLASAWGGPPIRLASGAPQNDSGGGLEEQEQEQGPYARWVRELMAEEGVRGLPRNVESLGRAIDSREFWETFALTPLHTLLSP